MPDALYGITTGVALVGTSYNEPATALYSDRSTTGFNISSGGVIFAYNPQDLVSCTISVFR